MIPQNSSAKFTTLKNSVNYESQFILKETTCNQLQRVTVILLLSVLLLYSFIRSLARCVRYEAKGGKSKSMFLKTFGMFYAHNVITNVQKELLPYSA